MKTKKRKIQLFFIPILCVCCILFSALTGEEIIAKQKPKPLPILMYHHFVTSGSDASGATITEDRFRQDMNYLKANEYTPLLPKDLEAIKLGKMIMPEKPVMITFDDGYESNYKIAYPILKETQMKATIFVIAKSMDTKPRNKIAKLSWDQMKEMYDSGLVDIQSHSYNLHNEESNGKQLLLAANGIQRGLIESRAQYELRLEKDLTLSIDLIEEKIGNKVTCFAYPYGSYEEWSTNVLKKKGIMFGFMIKNQMGDLNGDVYFLSRYTISMKNDLAKLLDQIVGMQNGCYA